MVCLAPVSAGAFRYQLTRTMVPFPACRDRPIYWPQGAGEFRAGELRAGQVRIREVRIGKVGAGEVSAIEIRAGKPGAAEVCARKVRAGEVRTGEIRASQVNTLDVTLGKPAPDHGDGCLHVGPRRSLPRLAARIGWRPWLV